MKRPAYSSKDTRAIARMFMGYNDITVFVEDSSIINVHVNVIKSCLGERSKINRVFPLGSRDKLESESKTDLSINNIYICDGDLDLILKRKNARKNLYYINTYSIENIVISGSEISSKMINYCPSENIEEMNKKFDCREFITNASKELAALFVLYAVAHSMVTRRPETVKYSVFRLTDGNSCNVCRTSILKRIKNLRKDLILIMGTKKYIATRLKIIGNIRSQSLNPIQYVSGKDYLLTLLHKYVSVNFKFSGKKEVLVSLLSDGCNVDADPGLRKFVRSAWRRAKKSGSRMDSTAIESEVV